MLFHAPMCDSSLRLLGAGRKIKQKHKRNISILNEELSEENPDPWLVYHLASECYRIKDYEKALHLVNGSIFQFLSENECLRLSCII